MLRDGALSDARVVELVRTRLVPVWINIRTTPIPDLPALRGAPLLKGIKLDERGNVTGTLPRGFFVRSVVLASDGRTLLNPESAYFGGGHFPYAQVKPGDYLKMLKPALERQDERFAGNQ